VVIFISHRKIGDDANSIRRPECALKNETRFEVVEDIEETSDIRTSEVKVRVTIRRDLEYKPSQFTAGPYCLDVRVGQQHLSHYGLSEMSAREVACRYLLRHVKGLAPLLH
jgi:hypothetical protein